MERGIRNKAHRHSIGREKQIWQVAIVHDWQKTNGWQRDSAREEPRAIARLPAAYPGPPLTPATPDPQRSLSILPRRRSVAWQLQALLNGMVIAKNRRGV